MAFLPVITSKNGIRQASLSTIYPRFVLKNEVQTLCCGPFGWIGLQWYTLYNNPSLWNLLTTVITACKIFEVHGMQDEVMDPKAPGWERYFELLRLRSGNLSPVTRQSLATILKGKPAVVADIDMQPGDSFSAYQQVGNVG